jgi:hypothetical protein
MDQKADLQARSSELHVNLLQYQCACALHF